MERTCSSITISGSAARRRTLWLVARISASAWLVSLTLACSAASAQDGSSDWQRDPSDEVCTPTCRSGFECRQGECLPICSPPCGPGLLCSSGGVCVRTEEPAAPPQVHRYWGTPGGCAPACRSGFTCLSGQCVSVCNPVCPLNERCTASGECVPARGGERRTVRRDAPVEEDAAEEPVRSSSADSIGNLHVDVLGALQFGITPTLEFGKKVSGYLRVRPLNTGVASYFMLGRDRDDELHWGIGAGIGMHVFSAGQGNMRGLFGGPGIEYVFVKTRDVRDDFARYRTHALIPQLDLGHRWAFGSFLLGVGGRVGLTIPIHSEAQPIGPLGCANPDSCDPNPNLSFVAGAFLDLGWFF